MRVFWAAIIAVFVAGIVGLYFNPPPQMNNANRLLAQISHEKEMERLHGLGVANPTWREEVTILGIYPLVSETILGKAPGIRRVTFRDPLLPYRYEAIVNCARPRIYGDSVEIYMRKHGVTGRVTFYVLCAVDAPAAPGR